MTPRGPSVRFLHRVLLLLLVSATCAFPQDTTLVYQPDIQIGAGGPVSFLEERVDGELTRRVELAHPGYYTEIVQKRHADGRMRRLAWYYTDEVGTGEYTIEEQDSQPDGTWTVTAILDYENKNITHARFYSGENLIEERLYEYDVAGRVTSELMIKAFEDESVLLEFERPDANTVEAYEFDSEGLRGLVARLQYDDIGRLSLEERFVKGKFSRRDVYTYDANGKLIDHIKYDSRELPVRHVSYGFTSDGLPVSVVHRDVKDRILFGLSYTREQNGENLRTIITDSHGEVTGTIDYVRQNGRDVRRTEVFLLGSGKLEITYTDFDEYGNWLRKELVTYDGSSVKNRTNTLRTIRYFD